jgi:RNA polymerase sigma-70 factor (ECF subfamily)
MLFRRNNRSTYTEIENVWEDDTLDSILASLELRDTVRDALQCLKVEYRDVLVLREYEGLSYAEIGIITETSISSVKSRLFKARKALACKLAPYLAERRP